METFEATITAKGQVTVPAKLRSALGLKSGDKLVFRKDANGHVSVGALTGSLADLRGIVKTSPEPVDGDKIREWIEQSRGGRWLSRFEKP